MKITLLAYIPAILFACSSLNGNAQPFSPTDILGTWQLGNQRLIFESDASMQFCTLDVPFTLTANGTILTINSITTFNRVTGSGTANLIGNWRDDPNGEETYYRPDGRYLSLFDGEKIGYFGTFTTDFSSSPPTMSSCEFRAGFEVSGNTLTQWNYDNGVQTATINIVPQTSITFTSGGVSQTWSWAP